MIHIATELKTSITYTGTGSQKLFDIPFDYLRTSFVKTTVDDIVLTYGEDYVIINRQIEFTVAPISGSHVVIYRETTTDRLVSWADASVLKASDMTINQVQQLHILEEQQDWTKTNSIVMEGTIGWNARFHRIINVGDPVEPQDAVTKQYVEDVKTGFISEMIKVKNSAITEITDIKNKVIEAINNLKASTETYLTQLKDTFKSFVTEKTEEVNSLKESAVNETTNIKNTAIEELTTIKNAAVNETTEIKDEAVAVKNTAVEAATTAAEDAVNNVQTLLDEKVAAAENAKSVAVSSAESALASKNAALTSENNAKASETKSAKSEENAKAAETAAENSKKSASDSASAASSSAESALEAKTLAAASANSASASETSAESSAEAAASSANSATRQADRAQDIADSLEGLAGITGVATTEEAIAGVVDTKVMTPLKTKEAVAAQVPEIMQEALQNKADLVDGKVPTNQLPKMDYVPNVGDTEIKGILTATNFKTNNTPLNAVDVCNKKYVDEEISNIDFPSAAPLPTNTDGVGEWTVVSTTLPNGGMWAYFGFYTGSGGGVNGDAHYAGIAAGGTTVSSGSWRHTFCWRIS